MKLRITHVITGLPRGGAEMMLYKFLSRIDPTRFESVVMCLKEEGPMARSAGELDPCKDRARSLRIAHPCARLEAVLREISHVRH